VNASETTRAVVATDFGGPEVLSIIEVPVGIPGPGEVLIDVRAAGANPIDYKKYRPDFDPDRSRLPIRLGDEASGVVMAVGDRAHGPAGPIRVGEEVIAFPVQGAYAGTIVVPESSVLPKPATLSFEQAAGLMGSGTTAVHALAAAGVWKGDTVLVHNASGGVGTLAVQLAVIRGARVIGTSSERRHAFLRELGAEPVAYGAGLLDRVRALAPGGVDAAIDAIGNDEALDTSLALVADRARIVTLLPRPRAREAGITMIGGGDGADPGTEIRDAARLELVRHAGKLRVVVAATYPLADVAEAHRQLAAGHSGGKIILLP
jgi:NADPH:quinone reductase-like Zn-dependent oxidoreductase